MTTAIIIQARMGSTRLPGKILAEAAGKPLLAHQVERLRRSGVADRVVVATTTEPADDATVEVAAWAGAQVVRGPSENVLMRYWLAANEVAADTIIRVTADCPLIDAAIVDETARFAWAQSCDLVAAQGLPDGMGLEVISRHALEAAVRLAKDPDEQEHVSLYLIRHPLAFRHGDWWTLPDRSFMRWTVDYPEDLELVRRIFGALYPGKPDFGFVDILGVLAEHPDWSAINANVVGTELDRQPRGQPLDMALPGLRPATIAARDWAIYPPSQRAVDVRDFAPHKGDL